ncbi:hypothetical protein [Bacillus weihaiensis]|uniref:hypothetical protein n=1 Tax=Bacillus weihaiensis TaxID=1547283 RepID=UPI00235448CF|nr:hypothetical protein [Bacillus weihaiensis]
MFGGEVWGGIFCLSVFGSLLAGASFSLFFSHWFQAKVHYLVTLCAAILLTVMLVDIVPHSLSTYNSLSVIGGMLVGLPIIASLDHFSHKRIRGD